MTKSSSSPQNSKLKSDFLIVGIGASALGIRSLKDFFQSVDSKSGMAFVICFTFSGEKEPELERELNEVTSIPITTLSKDESELKPNQIYAVPQNQVLLIKGDKLSVKPFKTMEQQSVSVDLTFRELADALRDRAVAVVLSGKGTEGSMGIGAIKEKNGMAIAQDPKEAQFPEMPRSSILQGFIDYILPVKEMPEQILNFNRYLQRLQLEKPDARLLSEPETEKIFKSIFTIIRVKTGHDFKDYKRATLLRRIKRRMSVLEINDFNPYSLYLEKSEEEVHILLKDLLISVTNFFRDPKIFKALEESVIPKLTINKNDCQQIRVWVPGCATGEEAYSLAMLFVEKNTGINDSPKVQIFATDIDEAALLRARRGYYTQTEIIDVSQERQNRFFIREGKGYRVRKEIREMILFVQHNLLQDPPFSKIDFVSCRNLLIYLNKKAQLRVFGMIHFALNPSGFLLLGTSESVETTANDYFSIYDREHALFQNRSIQSPTRLQFPVIDASEQSPESPVKAFKGYSDKKALASLHRQLLECFAPPSVLVNNEYEVVHISDHAGRFLSISGGEPSYNLLKVTLPELKMELYSALYTASLKKQEMRIPDIYVSQLNEYVNLVIKPIVDESENARGYYLIIFEPSPESKAQNPSPNVQENRVGEKMEEEMVELKRKLRITAEQYEIQTEELRASNEEMQAVNEELSSSTEELEISREELQSMNEELALVNVELKRKIEELLDTNNNFQNLINSTNIGTIFLDPSFLIKLFTPSVTSIFNLIPSDYGRKLSDITHNIKEGKFLDDAQAVIKKEKEFIEREIETEDGKTYLCRALPYKTLNEEIKGVILTFVDITQKRNSEKELKEAFETNMEILKSIKDSFFALDSSYNFAYVNRHAEELWGKKENSLIGRNFWKEMKNSVDQEFIEKMKQVVQTQKPLSFESKSSYLNRWIEARIYPNKSGGLSCYFQDISKRKETEEALRSSEEHFRAIVNQAAGGVAKKDLNGNFLFVNKKFCEILGYEEEELLNMSVVEVTHPDDVKWSMDYFKHMIYDGLPYDIEKRYVKKDGSVCWVHNNASLIRNQMGQVESALTIIIDITENKEAIEKAGISETNLSIALDAAEMATWDWHIPSGVITWSPQFYRLFGLKKNLDDQVSSVRRFMSYVHPDDLMGLKAKIQKSVVQDKPYEYEFRIIRADNKEVRWMHSYGRIVERDGSQAIRLPGVMNDVTNHKMLEKQKDDFIGIASHELKTPVTSIKAYVQILQSLLSGIIEGKPKELLEKMNKQVERLVSLINDLLDTTRITEGRLELRKEKVDLNKIIQQVIDLLPNPIEKSKIQLELGFLPLIKIDIQKIEGVTLNLINNALKYAPESNIIVTTKVEKNMVIVSVKDFGQGIKREMLEKVFERFYRVNDSRIITFPGLGLGLYISKEMIKDHGGEMWVESEKKKGTTFFYSLPVN